MDQGQGGRRRASKSGPWSNPTSKTSTDLTRLLHGFSGLFLRNAAASKGCIIIIMVILSSLSHPCATLATPTHVAHVLLCLPPVPMPSFCWTASLRFVFPLFSFFFLFFRHLGRAEVTKIRDGDDGDDENSAISHDARDAKKCIFFRHSVSRHGGVHAGRWQ